jgi:hypothetical protein
MQAQRVGLTKKTGEANEVSLVMVNQRRRADEV